MVKRNLMLVATVFLGLVGTAGAHLVGNSLSVKGGEKLASGEKVNVSWNISVLHDGKIDIDFSSDGGTTWKTLKKDFAGAVGANTYEWTVSESATSNGKIRICQPATVACTDANNVSAPTTKAPYVLVSGAFEISETTGLIGANSNKGNLLMKYNSEAQKIELEFFIQQSQMVSLKVLDTQGKLVASILNKNYGQGAYSLAVPASQLKDLQGVNVLVLKIGQEVKTLKVDFSK